jgi:hypothetical protein
MLTSFDIRAEFPGNRHKDFKVTAESIEDAKPRAESQLRLKHSLPFTTQFEWRGAVVFIDHSPSV